MTEKSPIRFLCGRAGSGKSTAVLKSVRQVLTTGAKVFLIVPEQQSVVWEHRAARQLPKTASLQLEIVSFTRLANLVARSLGGLSYRYITKGGKAALMWSAMRTLAPSLSFYGSSARPDRAVPAILSAVSEMKRCGVTPEMLTRAAETLREDPECSRIADRAGDLAMLTAAYGQLVRASFDDDEDELSHLADRLAGTDFFTGAYVFVDSFFSLTPVENEIMYHIFRQAAGVTVTFSCLPDGADEAHLSAPRQFLTAMRRAADRANRSVETVSLTENHRATSAELRHLEAHLWDFSAPSLETPDRPDSVRVLTAADRYEEAEAAAYRITELVRGGARYGDIAVITRHADPLRGILDTALARHGIPYFLSAPADVTTRPAARLMLCALSVVSGGWRREDILAAVKTGLTGLTDDECDAFEAYTDTWHLRGEKSFSTPWNMNPDGYVPTLSERGRKLLTLVNGARDKLIPPLSDFAALFAGGDGTAKITDIGRGLYELLCAFGVWDALAAESRRLAAAGESRRADETARLWDVLMEALDTLARTLPDARADAAVYASLLKQVLSSVRMGAIPGGIDEVTVGEAHSVRLGEVPHVILVGAVEGEFPAAPADDGFFSDTDRIHLEGAGIVLSGTSDDRMREELFWFYRAVSLPHDSLTVLIPRTDGGDKLTPSMGAERITALLPHIEPESYTALSPAARIFSDAAARAAVRSADALTKAALAALGYENGFSDVSLGAESERVSPETAAALFPGDITLTQTRLDSFVLCRFGYFCKYVARLEEPKEASLTAVNVGTFVHRVFELFFTRLGDRPLPLPEEELLALTDEIVSQCVSEILPDGGASGRAAYLFSRLKRCVLPMLRSLSAEFAQSKFRPVRFELPVGRGEGAVPPLSIPLTGGRAVSLRGTVDRVDTWRDGEDTYVRVVDYKTGVKLFDPRDVQIGLNVQLLLYLFSILRAPDGTFREELAGDTTLRPAGVLYFSARPGENRADSMVSAETGEYIAESNIKKSGILLDDERVLTAMEEDLAGRFIPVQRKKDGSFDKNVRSAEEIAAMEKTMCETVAEAAEALLTGRAEADPRNPAEIHGQNPCEYCKMKPVCRAEKRKEDYPRYASTAESDTDAG